MPEEIPLRDLPESVLEEVARILAPYVIGFVSYTRTPNGSDVQLLGSGTLVSLGSTKAILTAEHVVRILPRDGRLGLVISQTPQRHDVDVQGLTYLRIARGTQDEDGPDLGAVVLSPAIAAALAARKSFYDLSLRREQLLKSPPDIKEGMWFINGFVDEYTWEELDAGKKLRIKGFYNLSGAGGPNDGVVVREHDYFEFPVSPGGRASAPNNFGGMSGGGLWQFALVKNDKGLKPARPLLSGVVFYQYGTPDAQYGVKCHGRRSVYRVAYDAIQELANKKPPTN